MSVGEITGYLACGLVFATFYVRTMVPLRVIAIVSNLAFISYAAMEGLVPVLVLHTLLLPVNLSRLYEIKKLIDFTRNAPENSAPIDAIIPFMNQKSIARGEHLFRKGDYSKNMYTALTSKPENLWVI